MESQPNRWPITIFHISDLHFGREDSDKLRALKDDVRRIKPDLICITGDIVDFPRKKHFLKAKEFIGILEQTARVYAVPGNHDALLGGPAIRRFKRHLDRDLEFGEHREIRGVDFCIFGFNSTFPSIRHFSNTGKITKRRLKRFRDRVKDLIEGTNRIGEFRYKNSYKIVLLHHHPVPTISSEAETMLYLRKAGEFLNEMARQDINIILHGHQHDPCDFSINYNIGGESDSMIILSAGTALKRLEFENGISKKPITIS